ncbi:hypothetical protein AB205_0040510, partial [Aquarana catesbeiana]
MQNLGPLPNDDEQLRDYQADVLKKDVSSLRVEVFI